MESVRAALHGYVNGAATGTSVLGTVVIGDHFELGDGVRCRLCHLVSKALVAGAISVVINAVHQKVIVSTAQAVDGKCAFPRRSGVGQRGPKHAR